MSNYNAPRPEYTAWEWAKSIGSRILFPPILIWDVLKLGVNKLAGEMVSELILPAQKYGVYDRKSTENLNMINDFFHKELTITTHD